RGMEIAERSSGIRHVMTLGKARAGEDLIALADAESTGGALKRRECDAEEVRWVAYTGGTTGRSKGVEIPDRALVHAAVTVTTSLGLPDVPRFLAVAPISHAGVLPILPTFLRGGTVVLQNGFDPEAWLRTVQDERINWTFLV